MGAGGQVRARGGAGRGGPRGAKESGAEMALPVQAEEYKVKLEVFEGPLDLLLYLIKKNELDIQNIPMELVTRQYIEHLEGMDFRDLNQAGDFLVMAATLMMIKSRMLLPAEERPEEEEEEEDPRWDLVRQLVEYKKFKDTAMLLGGMEAERADIFGRDLGEAVLGKDTEMALRDVGLYDLINAFSEALKKVKEEDLREIFAERFTVAEKMESLGTRLQREKRFSLTALLDTMKSRSEIVCAFLALLELIRLRRARAVQSETYGEIMLEEGAGDAEMPASVEEAVGAPETGARRGRKGRRQPEETLPGTEEADHG